MEKYTSGGNSCGSRCGLDGKGRDEDMSVQRGRSPLRCRRLFPSKSITIARKGTSSE